MEENKSSKDKSYHKVTLLLISEKHEKEAQHWNIRVSEMEKILIRIEPNLKRI